ncbi:NUDIX hydrolase [Terrihabitans soli]|nr:NUDIX domain-containing protein [Terrihabitans soli]
MNPGLKDQPRPPYHPSQKRPRDAAVLILLDRSGPQTKVLLGQRHSGHVFMPGLHVFPGGKVEAADARAPATGHLPPHVERRLLSDVRRPSSLRARAYALAAIRELAEETGLMLGRKPAHVPAMAGDWKPFAAAGVVPNLDHLFLVCRSITPPGLARRYDTRFFATDLSDVCHRIEGVIHKDAELVELRWTPLGHTDGLHLHQITRLVLQELEARLKSGLERDLPVPFYRPRKGRYHRDEI